MNKDFILTALAVGLAVCFAARAADADTKPKSKDHGYYVHQGQVVTKIEAARILLLEPTAKVSRCVDAELDSNIKLKVKRQK